MHPFKSSFVAARSAGVLLLAITFTACDEAAPVEHPLPMPVLPSFAATVTPKPSGVAWSYDAPPARVPEAQGSPVKMAAGERCKTFRRLPSLRYAVNTLVEDACLEIPSDTKIEVRDGATLAIVATNGLLLGKNVSIDAKGIAGRRGARATFSSVTFSPASDTEFRALCVDRGNQCGCPSSESSLATVRGQTGEAGSSGGSLRVLAGELVAVTRFAGLSVDVSGGAGGPPGDSGTQVCTRGELRCVSPECSTGVTFGARGQSGTVSFAIGGAVPAAALERLKAATVPAEALTEVSAETSDGVLAEAGELHVQALRQGWQRRAGESAD